MADRRIESKRFSPASHTNRDGFLSRQLPLPSYPSRNVADWVVLWTPRSHSKAQGWRFRMLCMRPRSDQLHTPPQWLATLGGEWPVPAAWRSRRHGRRFPGARHAVRAPACTGPAGWAYRLAGGCRPPGRQSLSPTPQEVWRGGGGGKHHWGHETVFQTEASGCSKAWSQRMTFVVRLRCSDDGNCRVKATVTAPKLF